MANNFQVRVSAIDDFTKTFRKLNDQASKAARPLVNVQRQVGALSREMHLNKVAKGMGNVSNAAVTMGRTLGLSLGPLETVLGAGGIVGGLLAAGGAAIGLGVRFASSGFEINRTSQRLGISSQALQDWRGAAQLAGVHADVLTNTLDGLGTTLHNAKWGRDAEALQALEKLGIGTPMKNGMVDVDGAMNGIALAMSRIADPHVREALANALHIPPDAIPLLMQGPEAISRLSAEFRRLHGEAGPQALQWSVDFTNSLNRLKAAADGVGNSIGSRMVPALTKGMDALTGRLTESHTNPFPAAMGFNGDAIRAGMRLTGVSALFDTVSHGLFGERALTTAAQRSVSGQIGGSLRPGALPEAIKRNNPGNLRSWGGVPSVGGFAQFASPGDGLRAMGEQLGLYGSRGIDTPRSIIGKYAPPSENNTGAYVDDVSKKTGFSPDQHLDLDDRETRAALMAAMVSHEQGKQPFSKDQYNAAAVQSIELHVHGLPAGTRVTAVAKAQGGTPVSSAYQPTLTQYAMPSGDLP
jgi:hypothetical protein